MTSKTLRTLALAAFTGGSATCPAFAQGDIVDTHGHDPAALNVHDKPPPYSPNAGRNFPDRPLFGETHLHTTLSFDAGTFGAILGPRDAYRYANGPGTYHGLVRPRVRPRSQGVLPRPGDRDPDAALDRL